MAPKHREDLLSRKLLLLLVLMSAEPSSEFMHTLDVIPSVHLQAKGPEVVNKQPEHFREAELGMGSSYG